MGDERIRVGDWCVEPTTGQLSRAGESVRVEARTLRLLLCLAARAGQVVSVDDLLTQVWSGVIVTPDSVYQAVAALRRLLGDDARQPAYIATVPRLGYRMVAAVGPWIETAGTHAAVATGVPLSGGGRRSDGRWIAVAVFCLAVCIAILILIRMNPHRAVADGPRKSVAVLPFLDLTTQEMNEEYFADGMTEELIGRLSKVPGLRVPAPTASFYFKGKQVPVADIANSLGVTYLLDGSVRKSGATLRIAVRLIHAADGYVVWSETYDRPLDDKLTAQTDIAGEVTKALRAAID